MTEDKKQFDSLFTKAEFAMITQAFLDQRGEQGATADEIHQVHKELHDIKFNYLMWSAIQLGKVKFDVINGEVRFWRPAPVAKKVWNPGCEDDLAEVDRMLKDVINED